MSQLFFAISEQHRQDLLREAAQDRRAAQAQMPYRQPGQHTAVLAWLGEQMIAWGWRLRARYGKVEHRQAV